VSVASGRAVQDGERGIARIRAGEHEEGMSMRPWGKLAGAIALSAVGLSACVTYPNPGPTSPAYIGNNKTPAEFGQADAYCRNVAQERSGIAPGDAAAQSTAGSAVLGTLLGAGLGAAIGGGAGALVGAGQGSAAGAYSAAAVQQRYDAEYNQCMFAAGHKVRGMTAAAAPPPPPPGYGSTPPPPRPGQQAPMVPSGDPTRGQLQNGTRWLVQVYIDQDPSRLQNAPFLALNPGAAAPQNLDIGTHRIIAQAFVETQFGTRPVGQLDRTIQVDPRGSGWNLTFGENDFR
jgi:hypothetical protein